MITLHAFDSTLSVCRFLVKKRVAFSAPTLVIFAGIHGNETSGLFAIQKVFQKIEEQKISLKGNVYALTGNLPALVKNKRYIASDLNRLWTEKHLERIKQNSSNLSVEELEQKELYYILKDIIASHTGKFYFIDLHTTSAPTCPFITINDSINNRIFSAYFPLPVVLGIEEFIAGPLLTFINEFGHVSIGFEAGQHYDKNSIKTNESFLWLTLFHTECIEKKDIKDIKKHIHTLKEKNNLKGQFFEIDFKYAIQKNENFIMLKGFENFQKVKKNDLLATTNGNRLVAGFKSRLFMPLYQNQGLEGYFLITRISKFWLVLSKYARQMHLHNLLRILPGIRQSKKNKYTLVVNPRTARFLTNEIFHLFGYRRKVRNNGIWYFTKRDRKIEPFE